MGDVAIRSLFRYKSSICNVFRGCGFPRQFANWLGMTPAGLNIGQNDKYQSMMLAV